MVLGIENEKIVKLAVESSGDIVNGYCIYDCEEENEKSKVRGLYLFNNEHLHPDVDKHYIYLLGVQQNTDFDMQCYDCNFNDNQWVDPEYKNKEECCMACWIEERVENFDDENREDIELQIREIISDIVSEDLDKLNTIRLGIYKKFYSTTQYEQELYNNNYEMNVLDELVDNAYDGGLSIIEPKKFLSGDVDELMNKLDYIRDNNFMYNNLSEEEDDLAYNLHEALLKYNLDKALELLK